MMYAKNIIYVVKLQFNYYGEFLQQRKKTGFVVFKFLASFYEKKCNSSACDTI